MPEVVQLENGVPTTSEGAMASGMATASTVAMASPMGPRGGWRCDCKDNLHLPSLENSLFTISLFQNFTRRESPR